MKAKTESGARTLSRRTRPLTTAPPKMKAVPAVAIPEHEAARLWRESRGWTRPELAALVGFSVSQIQDYEAGTIRGSGRVIGPMGWKRYRNACAAVEAGLNFTWGARK